MARLTLKIIVILLPLFAVVAGYVWLDPFEVVRRHDRYYGDPRLMYNRDHHSLEIFSKNHPEQKYDSFVFGSSRSLALACGDWRQHIAPGRPFHFDASAESIYGISRKVRFLDRQGVTIANALVVLDRDSLIATANYDAHLYIKHPGLSGESPWTFQKLFFQAFASPEFLAGYAYYRFTNKVPQPFKDYFLDREFVYEPVTNDIYFASDERQIAEGTFYAKNISAFLGRKRGRNYAAPIISARQLEQLAEIRDIFRRHNTRYRIVVSPIYNQIFMNERDLEILRELFGADRVHDYSGVNPVTADYRNFYDVDHLRRHVGAALLAEIYRNGP
ncbi:MAG: hypothetical protein FDZ69_00005 [Deltaproteobacteria bacterium]|nr:MAG: hypothetical protein FDZ69_00005 [Deltaproteobacteria bacterium]